MKNAFQTRILAMVLAAATLAACVFAGLNVAAESDYSVPTDGICAGSKLPAASAPTASQQTRKASTPASAR